MKILIAPDKFKGSLEASDVCRAIEAGVILAFPESEIVSIPLADGGEGTTQILTKYTDGRFLEVQVEDPLGRQISAGYGISGDGETAFVEMAAASGLLLLSRTEYNPFLTSTFGTGQLILDALNRGSKRIILGIGGSATTDAGLGMAAALGYQFLDENEQILLPVGQSMAKVKRIDASRADTRLWHTEMIVACDVTNPLYGESGAAFVYGPQKGADAEMVQSLDLGLRNLSEVATNHFGQDISNKPGAGAAGGLGAGALWFLGAKLEEGVKIVMSQADVESYVREADLIITGEGKVDEQTLQGKVIKGLADLCRANGKPLTVICGTLDISPDQIKSAGITSAMSVLTRPTSLTEAQGEAFEQVRDATFNMVRLFFARG
jgi:glycerate 2-kinase